MAFNITGEPPKLCWEIDPVKLNADEAMADEREGSGPSTRIEVAIEWLRNELGDWQEHLVADLKVEAKANALNWRTVERAKEKLGVIGGRAVFGGKVVWRLPRPAHTRQHGENGDGGGNGEYGGNGVFE